MPRKFSFMWCFSFVKIWALKYIYLRPTRLAKWVVVSAISDHIFKKENYIYVQKVVFLDNFERIFEKFQSVAKQWSEI